MSAERKWLDAEPGTWRFLAMLTLIVTTPAWTIGLFLWACYLGGMR